jgi:hypothetical protein
MNGRSARKFGTFSLERPLRPRADTGEERSYDCFADKTAVQFPAIADAAFLCVRSKPFVATQRKSPKRKSKLVIGCQSKLRFRCIQIQQLGRETCLTFV